MGGGQVESGSLLDVNFGTAMIAANFEIGLLERLKPTSPVSKRKT